MKRSKRALTAALAATGMACAGLVATAPTASAAATGATAAYNGVCGSGYKVVNSAPVGTVGTVYLTYNSTSGKNCVVTIRNTSGSPTYMFAYLNTLDDPSDPAYDEGEYRSYAGPVYKYARGMCVEWGGIISSWESFNTGSNCGSLAKRAAFAGKD